MSQSADQLTDREAMQRVVDDYYESWFTGDRERMVTSLHPDLAKRRVLPGGTGLELDPTSADEMAEATAAGHGTRYKRGHQVEVFDINAGLASVKVISNPYVEYLHLARFGDRWLIVDILWRSRSEDAGAG